jgi:hypothetical protein
MTRICTQFALPSIYWDFKGLILKLPKWKWIFFWNKTGHVIFSICISDFAQRMLFLLWYGYGPVKKLRHSSFAVVLIYFMSTRLVSWSLFISTLFFNMNSLFLHKIAHPRISCFCEQRSFKVTHLTWHYLLTFAKPSRSTSRHNFHGALN